MVAMAKVAKRWAVGRLPSREGKRRGLNEKTLIISLDLAGSALSGVGALWVWVLSLGHELLWWHPVVLVILGLVWTVGLTKSRALSGRLRRSLLEDLPTIVGQVLSTSMAVNLVVALAEFDLDNVGLVVAAGLGILAMPVARGFSYALLNREGRVAKRKILIIGAGKVGTRVANLTSKNPQLKAEVVGFLDKEPLVSPSEGSQAG